MLEDKTMLSLPIPELPGQGYAPDNLEEVNWRKYDELAVDDDIKKHYQLSGKYCHLDPDIRPDLWRCGDNWRAAFGQCDTSGGHLKKQIFPKGSKKKEEEILFLFWGLFQHWSNGRFTEKPFHAVWGYMVCDEVIEKQQDMPPYHPHRKLKKAPNAPNKFNNLLFIAKDECYGTFEFCEKLVLSDLDAKPYAKTKWKIAALPWFEYMQNSNVEMSYHPDKAKCFPEGKTYFQACKGRGQEFVVSPGVTSVSALNWKNCSFEQILSNLKEMYPEKRK